MADTLNDFRTNWFGQIGVGKNQNSKSLKGVVNGSQSAFQAGMNTVAQKGKLVAIPFS